MPTPFMHMALAQRLIHDPDLPSSPQSLLDSNWGAFLLGSIAPDARVSSGLKRVDTHFFEYQPVIDPRATTAMLSQHPELKRTAISDEARTAFIAGYIGHLVMDEIWCVDMLFPHFFRDWATEKERMLFLHILLAHLDERDWATLPSSHYYTALSSVNVAGWLPFMTDADLIGWRDIVAPQLAPDGANLTFKILGQRVGLAENDMAALVHDDNRLTQLWTNIAPDDVSAVETTMYRSVLAAIVDYLA